MTIKLSNPGNFDLHLTHHQLRCTVIRLVGELITTQMPHKLSTYSSKEGVNYLVDELVDILILVIL